MTSSEYGEKMRLLKRAGRVINSIIRGLDEVDLETRQRIMEISGQTCAIARSLNIAKRIAEESDDEKEILRRVNNEIPWCGTWTRRGSTIQSKCIQCGCPLVRNKIVDLTGTFCYCSKGWVRTIFETLFGKPVTVELAKSIGRGDKICKFVVHK